MKEIKLKGIWIPKEILLNKEIGDKEKIILSMIVYLSDETPGCFASNRSIANIVNVTQERVSKIISTLRDKGYIEVKLNYILDSKEVENRQIKPIKEKIYRHGENDIYPDNENNNLNSYKRQIPIVKSNKEIINNNKNKKYYKNTPKEKSNYYRYKSDRDFENFDWDKLYVN